MRFRSFFSILFLGFILLCTLWMIIRTVVPLFSYFYLNQTANAKINTWTVIEVDENAYGIESAYSFEYEGAAYEGRSLISDVLYLNEYAALTYLDEIRTNEREVWFHAAKPTISSLYKIFPIKKVMYALIMVGISLYFIVLKKHFVEVVNEKGV